LAFSYPDLKQSLVFLQDSVVKQELKLGNREIMAPPEAGRQDRMTL